MYELKDNIFRLFWKEVDFRFSILRLLKANYFEGVVFRQFTITNMSYVWLCRDWSLVCLTAWVPRTLCVIKDKLQLRFLKISNVHTRSHTSLNFVIKRVKAKKPKKNSPMCQNPDFNFKNLFEFFIILSRLCRKWIFYFCVV